MDKKIILGHILAISTIFIWGTTFVSTKILLAYLTPIEILVCRFIIGYLLLFIIHPRIIKLVSFKEELLFFALGFFGICSYYLLENIALKYTLASNVGFYTSTTPIITSLLVTFILKEEKFKKYLLIGFLIAMTGVYIIMFKGGLSFQLNLKGDLLALTATISFSIYSMLLRKLKTKMNFVFVTRKIFFYGLVCMMPVCIIEHPYLTLNSFEISEVYLNLLFLGVIASSLCFFMWNKSIALIGPEKASIYIYLVPVITAISSIIILDEKLTPSILLGGALILLGAIYSETELNIFKALKRKKDIEYPNINCNSCS